MAWANLREEIASEFEALESESRFQEAAAWLAHDSWRREQVRESRRLESGIERDARLAARRAWWARLPEKAKEEHRRRHRERCRLAYAQMSPEKRKARAEKHRETARRWYARPEVQAHRQAYNKAYWLRTKHDPDMQEKARARREVWRKANPDKVRASIAKYRKRVPRVRSAAQAARKREADRASWARRAEAVNAKRRAALAAETPEEKEARREKAREGQRERRAKLRAEKLALRAAVRSQLQRAPDLDVVDGALERA